MYQGKECAHCGARLDPGERCDCDAREEEADAGDAARAKEREHVR